MNEVKNAIIKTVSITSADHGYLMAWLYLDFGDTTQAFGGYSLYLPASFKHHKLESVAGHFIWRCMEIAGVTEWSEMIGKTIRVRGGHTRIDAIGHIINDDWFCPSEEFNSSKEDLR